MLLVNNIQSKIQTEEDLEKLFERVISYALKEEQVKYEWEVSILLVDNEEIRRINKEHRNIDRETDVLSFPMLDYPEGNVYKDVYLDKELDDSNFDGDNLVLGDIVISLEKAMEQSKEYGHSFIREVAYLSVHSILHLLGYDHMEENDKRRMREREEAILGNLDITREQQ
ncbi:rRNA maturation RNase YbeY [Clostridium oryzae]|uniref:Endoribonuclease YbeY n=1 Tax=Clostridium oryzae TaxID=1450648 RepID=A0A1V4IHI4_9CLOT|nr:rRNA maturation RNase YbeY [Clostridium oryzae]OPJ59461.1 endoribonuclease YbeY [Clostridium oryzae]